MISRSSVERARRVPSSVVRVSPCARPTDHDRPLQPVTVVAVDRVAQLEHHVVRDVDGERDRAHPGQLHAPRQPAGAGRGRVEAGHGAGHEDRAAVGGLDPHRVAGAVRLGGLPLGWVGVRRVVRQRRLARDPPQRQRIGTVGVDLELDHVVAQVEVGEGVVTRLPRVGRQHDDPGMIVAKPELLRGADHARGDVAVGLARGDLEATRQHATREHHHDQVADREVVCATHDALRLTGAVCVADVDGAPVDGLPVLLRLGLHRQHPADDERPGDVVAGVLQPLELEPERGQPAREVAGGDAVGQVDVVTDPGKGCPHGSDLRSEGAGEADVALEEVAQVLRAVAEHEHPVDAEAEREAACRPRGRCRRRPAPAG